MQDLVRNEDELTKRADANLSFEERIRRALGKPSGPRTSALMLDVSGSMEHPIGANQRGIDKLRELAGKFADVRRFEFSSGTRELAAHESISEPHGGTQMDDAFASAKRGGVSHLILITDGQPNNEDKALREAQGLRIDVFYCGPDGNRKAQEFLAKLGKVTGGSYGKVSLKLTKELEAKVRALLPAPASAKGPIAL